MALNTSVTAAGKRRAFNIVKATQQRTFASSSTCLVNPLLNLSHFSASKEAQYLSKERKIPREEFHPYLELIRTSEVDPFAPAPGASPTVVAALKRAQTGQSDMQTAYSLAVANLIQQLQHSRKEAAQTQALLARIHDKYKREERNSFLVMLTAVAVLSLIFVKTDALQDLKAYARQLTSEWKAFDWEWLGNPPSYRKLPAGTNAVSTELEPVSPSANTLLRAPIRPVEAQSDRQTDPVPSIRIQPEPKLPSSRSAFSRMFWASSNNSDS